MKRLKFHRAIVAIAMMLIGWLPSLAHDFEVNGIFYDKLNSSKVAVTYKGEDYYDYSNEYAGDVVIPSSVNYNGTTYSVTSIGDEAFCGCTSLTSIEIPNNVTSIGDVAFNRCTSLTSIVIPNSVTSIGDYAFLYCSGLTSVIIGNSVTSIGDEAFYGCTSLTNVVIGKSVTSIGYAAFRDCSSLTSIVVDSGNTKYDSRNDCNAIIETASNTLIAGCQNTIIPNSVTSIGYAAFEYCSSLTSIQIPNSVTSIGDYAFRDCSSMTSIEIPNSVTSIGDGAFVYCESLTSIIVDAGNTKYDSRNECNAIIETASNTLITGCQNTIIPNSVTSIGDEAFCGCTSMTSIEIPNSVTSIGDWAFVGCTSLTSIEIPNSVTSIGDCAFGDCSSLTSIVVDAGNSIYDSRNDCNAIIETASNTLIAGCKNTIIPNSVTSIGYAAFSDCSTSIEIPNSVTSIGVYAFANCSGLASVVIGNSVTSIGNYAFSGCSSLTRITCHATTPPTIESDTFSDYSADLYVPTGCKAAYEVADYWENFNNIIEVTLDNPITLNDNDAIVATIGDYIVVKNATVGSVVRVYTADGAMIASEVATDGDIVVEVPEKGIYVVTVGKKTVKVII